MVVRTLLKRDPKSLLFNMKKRNHVPWSAEKLKLLFLVKLSVLQTSALCADICHRNSPKAKSKGISLELKNQHSEWAVISRPHTREKKDLVLFLSCKEKCKSRRLSFAGRSCRQSVIFLLHFKCESGTMGFVSAAHICVSIPWHIVTFAPFVLPDSKEAVSSNKRTASSYHVSN